MTAISYILYHDHVKPIISSSLLKLSFNVLKHKEFWGGRQSLSLGTIHIKPKHFKFVNQPPVTCFVLLNLSFLLIYQKKTTIATKEYIRNNMKKKI